MCSYDRLHVFHSGKSFFLIPLYFFYFFLPQGRVDDPRTEEENDSSDDELEQLLYFPVGPGHVELSEDEGHSDRAAGDGGEADAEEDDEDGQEPPGPGPAPSPAPGPSFAQHQDQDAHMDAEGQADLGSRPRRFSRSTGSYSDGPITGQRHPRPKSIGNTRMLKVQKKIAQTERMKNREINKAAYRKRVDEDKIRWMAMVTTAHAKLDEALREYDKAGSLSSRARVLFEAIASDKAQVDTKFNFLLKRVQVVRYYLKLQLESGNTKLMANQKLVAGAFQVSPARVRLYTCDFLRTAESADTATAAALVAAVHTTFCPGEPPLQPPAPPPPPQPPATPPSVDTFFVADHPLRFSPINTYTVPAHMTPHISDAHIKGICVWYIRTHAHPKGKPNMKASGFQKWVNTDLIPKHIPGHAKISNRTAKRWIKDLGFVKTHHKKTMYVDGHERKDVVEDRARFVKEILSYVPFMQKYGNLKEGDDKEEGMKATLPAERYYVNGTEVVTGVAAGAGKELVLVVHDETVIHQNDLENWSYQLESGSSACQQKGNGAGYHISGFLSEKFGRLKITEEQWQAHLGTLDEAAKLKAQPSEFHKFHFKEGEHAHLEGNLTMFIGVAHRDDVHHPTGYWQGDDIYKQLEHAITIFEILHPGCTGLWLFDNSTGHSKMPRDALLADGMAKGPGGKFVSTFRETTWKDKGGVGHRQSFVFEEGDALKYKVKARVGKLDTKGLYFEVGARVEAQRPGQAGKGWTKDAEVVRRVERVGEGDTYLVRFKEGEEAVSVDVGKMQMPLVQFEAGTLGAGHALIGHSKGLKQICMERDLVKPDSKMNGVCGSKQRKERKEAMASTGIGKEESVEVPLHMGFADEEACCLAYLLSQQPDFIAQQNAIQEYIESRGHLCIFLPKYHPELNAIERYWSRIKLHTREHCDGTKQRTKKEADLALNGANNDLALIRRYFRTAWRWIDAYSRGLDGVLALFAVTKSKKHRGVTDAVDRAVNALAVTREAEKQARVASAAAAAAAAAGAPPPPLPPPPLTGPLTAADRAERTGAAGD